ncbi:hypothetical protein T552_03376 [Pneumocystis carinii B80]|uniref:ENTH domain-containing protein n=1 Tax=Pneumocystis carinii (strain B80) TaxID=1408658 RepID=A0A0W4ZBP0_PNEC8|nr:hypothetical protein T552_03376 [Pneumocystis carinii B80]KTW25763.1 hypothetical protein T552_03376 [Pneumocystis carinii B80]
MPYKGLSYQKAVNGATKIKLAAPKQKYLESILGATYSGDIALFEVFSALFSRLHEPSWTIVFKSLIVIHIMIRDGSKDITLRYLSNNMRYFSVKELFGDPSFLSYDSGGLLFLGELAISQQSKNIQNYGLYLQERIQGFKDVQVDYVYAKSNKMVEGRLRRLTVAKGLLREVEIVQRQIDALLCCKLLEDGLTNDITIAGFRLLIRDLLSLFQVINEGVINVLEHYFEMSKYDAEKALEIYKKFVKQTVSVSDYLSFACRMETLTCIEVPNIKHAPVGLSRALQEYLDDKNFEKNRLQYIESKNALDPNKKKTNLTVQSTKTSSKKKTTNAQSLSGNTQKQNLNNINLIDFFSSIENEQAFMFPNTPGKNMAYKPSNFSGIQPTQPIQTVVDSAPTEQSIPSFPQNVPPQMQPQARIPYGLSNQYSSAFHPNNVPYQSTQPIIQNPESFQPSFPINQKQDYNSIYPTQANLSGSGYNIYHTQSNVLPFNQPPHFNQVIPPPVLEMNNSSINHTNPFHRPPLSMNTEFEHQRTLLANQFPPPTNPFSKSFDNITTPFIDPKTQTIRQNASTLPFAQKPRTNPFSNDNFPSQHGK